MPLTDLTIGAKEPKATTRAVREGEVDRVFRILKGWLIECTLPPGEAISEVDLAHKCNTSRTPVREACNRLSQDGWLTRVRQKGYLVTPVSVRDLLQIYEYRRLLECFTAEKAAQVITAKQFDYLARIVEVEQNHLADVKDVLPVNDPFHLGIAEIAGNRRVINQVMLSLEYCHRVANLATPHDRSWMPHGEILEALRARKPSEARLAMAAHIEAARDRMVNLFAS